MPTHEPRRSVDGCQRQNRVSAMPSGQTLCYIDAHPSSRHATYRVARDFIGKVWIRIGCDKSREIAHASSGVLATGRCTAIRQTRKLDEVPIRRAGDRRARSGGVPSRLARLQALCVGARRAEAAHAKTARLVRPVAPDDAGRCARHVDPYGPPRRSGRGPGAHRAEAVVRQGHLRQEFRDHDPAAWRAVVRVSAHR